MLTPSIPDTMKIPTPQELGFSEKFEGWRPAQIEALRWLSLSSKRVKAFCAATGFGKTPVVVAHAVMSNLNTCIVTENRGLQSQAMEDYGGLGMVDLRGRSNYTCDLRPDYTCDMGYAAKCSKKGTIHCPASQAEMRAATSKLVITNYAKWTSSRKFGQGMDHFDQVIFDEGHETHKALCAAMSVTLSHRETEELLGLDFPNPTDAEDMVNWKPWVIGAKATAEAEMLASKERVRGNPGNGIEVRRFLHLTNLCKRLNVLATAQPENWIADTAEKGYVFDPVRPGRYSEGALLLRVPSILVVSATIRPKTLHMIGVGKDHYDYREFESEFDGARHPVYYVPTMRVDSRSPDLSKLWILLDQIAARRTDRKGIVHTVSYLRREAILSRSRFAPAMLVNSKGEAATEIVNAFKRSKPGTILVSPSVGAGFDFPLTQCEWQFLCKIPFPNGQTKIHRARQEADSEYGAYQAMTKMEQTFGRGMRSKEDQCEGFIGDEHLDWFLPKFAHLASKSFLRVFKKVRVVPPPPPKL